MFVLDGVKAVIVRSLLLALLLPLASFAQLIVDTTAQNKKVVLEEFTGIHCVFCPDGHYIAQQIKNTYPNDVFLVNLHTGGYASPNPGEPDFRIMESDSIAEIADLAGYPAGSVNRKVFGFPWSQLGGSAMSRGDWMDACTDVMSQPSYANVGVLAVHDTINETLVIDVEIYYTDSTPVDGFGFSPINYINVALIQDSVAGPQTGGSTYNPGAIINGPWQPTYSHQHMLRDMIAGQWGEAVNNSPAPVGPGHFVFKRFFYPVPPYINDVMFKMEHIKAVAFLTEGQYGEIVTANGCSVTYPAPPPVGWAEILPNGQHVGVTYDIYGRVVTDIKKNTIYIRDMKKFIQF